MREAEYLRSRPGQRDQVWRGYLGQRQPVFGSAAGGSLYGLQQSSPVDTFVAYGEAAGGQGNPPANASTFGTTSDPLVGLRIGGINVFGGGLVLYQGGVRVGGLAQRRHVMYRSHGRLANAECSRARPFRRPRRQRRPRSDRQSQQSGQHHLRHTDGKRDAPPPANSLRRRRGALSARARYRFGRSTKVNIMELKRRRFLRLAAGASAPLAGSRIARAQAYPSRPGRIMSDFARTPADGYTFSNYPPPNAPRDAATPDCQTWAGSATGPGWPSAFPRGGEVVLIRKAQKNMGRAAGGGAYKNWSVCPSIVRRSEMANDYYPAGLMTNI
jgi:hypothetical protein